MVAGVEIPPTLKPVPAMVNTEIVRSEVPVLDNVRVVVVLLPTVALPASRLAGLTTSCGCGVTSVAVTAICEVAVDCPSEL